MATDYGVDVACVDDVGTSYTLVTGVDNLANALARRLGTPRGRLFYDPDYGTDLRSHLNGVVTAGQMSRVESDVVEELSKDERVAGVTAKATWMPASNSLNVTISIETVNDETFDFVLGVSSVTVELLRVN